MKICDRRAMVAGWTAFCAIVSVVHIHCTLAWSPLVTRKDFVDGIWAPFSILAHKSIETGPENVSLSSTLTPSSATSNIQLGLRFLPKSGCWALRTTLTQVTDSGDEDPDLGYTYFGILDTGSPFLTVSRRAQDLSRPTLFAVTNEQYGETIGTTEWRKVDIITWVGGNGQVLECSNVVLGIVSENVINETGGIFVGLVAHDDNRPTFLEQIGDYRSFRVCFARDHPTLTLFRRSIIPKKDAKSFQLFDLSSYGPDLYHYAIQVEKLDIQWRSEAKSLTTVLVSSLQRPVIAVLDTGLTGCIISTSLAMELGMDLSEESVQGLDVTMPTLDRTSIQVSSSPEFWRLSCFRLPWFDDDDTHPHIVALGATFWANERIQSLTIDGASKRAKIHLIC